MPRNGRRTAFPIVRRLQVKDYGLYPGTDSKPGLDVKFEDGVTLVLGANGLGKTTLVLLMFRMCTGGWDIPGVAGAAQLGTRSLEAREISRPARKMFAERVNDGARDATATLCFSLGAVEIEISRTLSDLRVAELRVNGEERPASDKEFQSTVLEHSSVGTFGDWILLLRHLTFYFEERRALVWDPSAQRQILRVLFLESEAAEDWTRRERRILALDSRVRNTTAVVGREEREIASAELAASSATEARKELSVLDKLQGAATAKLQDLNEQIVSIGAAAASARLSFAQAETVKESAYRDLERRQLATVSKLFPSRDETATYLLAKLLSGNECLACGQEAPSTAADLRKRLSDSRCVVCNTPIAERRAPRGSGAKAIADAQKALTASEDRFAAASEELVATEAAHRELVEAITLVRRDLADRSEKIDQLVRQLPPDESKIREDRDQLNALRGSLEAVTHELNEARDEFIAFIDRTSRLISRSKDEIQSIFEEFAGGFLLEQVRLIWAPHKDRLGQLGSTIDFPAFELEMTGTDFSGPRRRHGPEQVSESQREFIDLAFRMTLMRVAGDGRCGSLVIDAPESSLDAVFVGRAAEVMTSFASGHTEDRLVVTSNLVEGDLIPALARRSGIRSARSKRVVDLLKVAAPTTATRTLAAEYADVRRRIFDRAKEGESA